MGTSRPHVCARCIVEHFDLSRFFTGIFGPELDGTRREKVGLIADLIDVQKPDPARANSSEQNDEPQSEY
jgi:phosphoglycolate phosphatase